MRRVEILAAKSLAESKKLFACLDQRRRRRRLCCDKERKIEREFRPEELPFSVRASFVL